jgi:rSAM/selenodomain-associated transferase 2
MAARLTIVVPVLNESRGLAESLQALAPLRARGHEVVVVDGGSDDASAELAAPLAERVQHAPPGRAAQMNAGARAASGDVLLFLHADTRLPAAADERIFSAIQEHRWGRFDVDIEGRHPLLRVVAAAMNLRSRLTGIATGDQAMFVRREAFPGFPEIALMEDIALSRLLKRSGRPACLKDRVRTSGRRWESRGVLRTILLMWRLRALFWLGVAPERLARRYHG